ncbi:hypothetical protein HG537_0E01960 [Torulaspora globosa]|uniref:BLOS1-homolog n=1 Tax=Torulaspora globosa TaxID=48254 RepID=A0A7H9HU25_9SACH|nr:hypothetical protein HG537_0E01960 [Torulaspora sp. CBS 2947]
MSHRNELDQVIDRIFKSTQETDASRTLKEIKSNNEYIMNTQLRKLVELHDTSFRQKCVVPMASLYERYSEQLVRDEDLQRCAELVDRDIRIIETAIELIKQSKK